MATFPDYLESATEMLRQATDAMRTVRITTNDQKVIAWLTHRAALLDDQIAGITRDIEDVQSVNESLAVDLQ